VVVVVEVDQIAELPVSGERAGLGRDPLHQIAVACHAVDEVIARTAIAGREARARGSRRERHTHAVGEALPERARRHLDTRRIPVLGVTGCLRVELPEAREIVEREPHLIEVEQRVEEHRRVTVRKDEAIAQRPGGIAGIEAQILVPELEYRTRETHRRPGMPGIGALDCIDGQEADRVLDTLPQRGSEGDHVAPTESLRRRGGRTRAGYYPSPGTGSGFRGRRTTAFC
jgi:hypothetical protein